MICSRAHFVIIVLTIIGTRSALGALAQVAGPIHNPANGHDYYLLGPGGWSDGEAQAVSQFHGHLATVRSASENDWIHDTFGPLTGRPGVGLWIGFSDALNEGNWVWSSGEPAGYSNWNPLASEPNGGGDENYAWLYYWPASTTDRKWNDSDAPNHDQFAVVEVPEPTAIGCFLMTLCAKRRFGRRSRRANVSPAAPPRFQRSAAPPSPVA